jgi:LPS sulfotransferase NodH
MDYIVATSARTGSNFLQRLTLLNGLANPTEFFHKAFGFGEATAQGIPTEQWLERANSENAVDGVFGVKVMTTHLESMARHAVPLERDVENITICLFPDARYVYLYREDIFRQAISVWRAAETGEYIKFSSLARPAKPSPRPCLTRKTRGNAGLNNNLEPPARVDLPPARDCSLCARL